MDAKYKKEVERLSAETGFPAQDIEKQIADLETKGKYDTESALAVWKSENSMRLGGKVEDVVIRVLAKSDARHLTGDRGEYDMAAVYAFASADAHQGKAKLTDIALFEMPLYNERIGLADGLEQGKTYEVKAKIEDPKGERMPRLRIISDLIPSTKAFPAEADLIAKMGVKPISEIENFIGTTGFFTGKIGRVFETKTGVGYEVSAIGVNAVAVFFNGVPKKDLKVGDMLIAFGYVSHGGDKTQISARGVF